MNKSTTIYFFILNFFMIGMVAIGVMVMKIDYDRKLHDLRIQQQMTIDHNQDLHEVIQSVLKIGDQDESKSIKNNS